MKTADQVKQDFIRQGISIAKWAEQHGYSQFTVYAVLNGTLKCRYGISHQIAVDLGLKEVPSVVRADNSKVYEQQLPRAKRRTA